MDQFLVDFKAFLKQYHKEGSMDPGLSPSEASEKLKIFQHQFDNFKNMHNKLKRSHRSTMSSYLLEQLQKYPKALTGYIEKKGASFPRFYFVYDPVNLEILSQSSNPQAIQPYLQSIFDNLVYLISIHSNTTRFSRCSLVKANKLYT